MEWANDVQFLGWNPVVEFWYPIWKVYKTNPPKPEILWRKKQIWVDILRIFSFPTLKTFPICTYTYMYLSILIYLLFHLFVYLFDNCICMSLFMWTLYKGIWRLFLGRDPKSEDSHESPNIGTSASPPFTTSRKGGISNFHHPFFFRG